MPVIDVVAAAELCARVGTAADLIDGPGNLSIEAFAPADDTCRPPFTLGDDEDSRMFTATPFIPRYAIRHGAAAVTLAALENATLATPHALVFDAAGRLLADSYHNAEMAPLAFKEARVLAERLMAEEPARIVEPACLLLAGPWSWNYHHWLLEDLSRLWAVERFPEVADLPIVIPADLTPFQRESLAAFGIEPARTLPFDGGRWRFRRLLVPSFLAPGGHSPRQMAWLRARLFAGVGVAETVSGTRKLYVARRGARARELLNEAEIAGLLATRGFETVDPGALSLRDQAALFAEARVVAGASGAGLSNILFAPPDAALIEFQPDSFVNITHWYVACALGQDYGFVIGPAATERHDFTVSPDKLAAALDAVPARQPHAAPSMTALSAATSARK